MDIPPSDIARVRELYGLGRYRQGLENATAPRPIREWGGTPARLIGGRLAIQLGAPNLGRRLHLLAFRATPAHPEAIYYPARYRLPPCRPPPRLRPPRALAEPVRGGGPESPVAVHRAGQRLRAGRPPGRRAGQRPPGA